MIYGLGFGVREGLGFRDLGIFWVYVFEGSATYGLGLAWAAVSTVDGV